MHSNSTNKLGNSRRPEIMNLATNQCNSRSSRQPIHSCNPIRAFNDRGPSTNLPLRTNLLLTLVCLALTTHAHALAQNPSLNAWPVFRGDAASTGYSPCKLPEKPEILWEFHVPKGAFEGTPAISDGKVFLGDADGTIYCWNLQDGTLIWSVKTESGFLSAPAVQDKLLVIADYDGIVRALNTDDGKELWTFEAPMGVDSGINFYQDHILFTCQAGILFALQKTDGHLVWKYQLKVELHSLPSIASNRTFLGGCDGFLHVIDLETGQLVSEPVPLPSQTGNTPAIHGDLALLPTVEGQVLAIEWKTNRIAWTFNDRDLCPEVKSSPAIHDGSVFITSRNSRVIALDLASGELRWQAKLRKRSDSSPVVCDGRLWVACADGRILALDLATGEVSWMLELGGNFMASPAIADNRLVLASDRGSIYCLGTQPSK